MTTYIVTFEVWGKRLRTKVQAKSPADAVDRVKHRTWSSFREIKTEHDPEEGIEFFNQIFKKL